MADTATIEELRALVRATHSKKLCRWLNNNGIAYRLDDKGQPIVLRSALEQAFNPAAAADADFVPDFSKLKETTRGKKTHSRHRST